MDVTTTISLLFPLFLAYVAGVVTVLVLRAKLSPTDETLQLIITFLTNLQGRVAEARADGTITAEEWRHIATGLLDDTTAILATLGKQETKVASREGTKY